MQRAVMVLTAVLLALGGNSASAQVEMVGFGARGSDYGSVSGGATLSEPAERIDEFWRAVFGSAQLGYRSPYRLVSLDQPMETNCGFASPDDMFFYCPLDESIYMAPVAIDYIVQKFGDYAPITVLAHEWAHHVQFQLGVPRTDGNAHELQADCLAGAWTKQARELGLLDKGDVTEAAKVSAEFGDDYLDPQDVQGAHGIDDDRIAAFMRGFDDGISDCDLPLAVSTSQVIEPTSQAPIGIPAYSFLPPGPALEHWQCFRTDGDGVFTLPTLLSRFSDVPGADAQLAAWGWNDGAYRQFGCDAPPAGHAGWIEVNIHQFSSPQAAQAAVQFFASARIANTSLQVMPPPYLGDASSTVGGPASNGTEVTMYASIGSRLVRVTGVAPDGLPTTDVAAVLQQVLAAAS